MDIEELFAETLLGEYNDDEPWTAVRALHQIGSREIFEKASSWCQSPVVLERARGADVLAQLGKTVEHPTNAFPEESFAILANLVETEQSSLPLCSALHGLGHTDNLRALPLIIRHSSSSDPDVRFAVACACGSFGNEQLALDVLLKLIKDGDSDVRDWATFGLGSLSELDTPMIRSALTDALSDSDADVRQEALVGLARRRDAQILPQLLEQLQQPEVDVLTIEAACEMLSLSEADSSWGPDDYVSALQEQFG